MTDENGSALWVVLIDQGAGEAMVGPFDDQQQAMNFANAEIASEGDAFWEGEETIIRFFPLIPPAEKYENARH